MMIHTSLLCLFLQLASVAGLQLQKQSLEVNEAGTHFNETIYTDQSGRYDLIKVPAHGDRLALTILNDFKLMLGIHKVDAEKSCWVKTIDGDEQRPRVLRDSVKAVHGVFPSSSFLTKSSTFIPDGNVDLDSPIGRLASRFCGEYEIVHAKVFKGDTSTDEMEDFVRREITKELQRNNNNSNSGNEKRAIAIRNFAACDPNSLNMLFTGCPNAVQELNFILRCRFSPGGKCHYVVSCQPDGDSGAQCNVPVHWLNYGYCCDTICP